MFRFCALLACVAVLAVAGCESASNPVATPRPESGRTNTTTNLTSTEYRFKALDVPAEWGAYTSVYGVNNSGVIAGNYFNVDETVHGFLYYRGQFTDVTIPGAAGFFSGSLGPVNDLGEAAGFYSDASDVGHAFVRARDGSITFLPDAAPDATDTDPTGMNNHGTIVGTYLDGAGHAHAFIHRDAGYELFDYPGATSTRLNGVNDSDIMVGQFGAAGVQHGFILANGQTTLLELPGARSTRATAINNRGDIVGFYNNSDGVFHGFVYRGGEFTTVDFPGSSDSGSATRESWSEPTTTSASVSSQRRCTAPNTRPRNFLPDTDRVREALHPA